MRPPPRLDMGWVRGGPQGDSVSSGLGLCGPPSSLVCGRGSARATQLTSGVVLGTRPGALPWALAVTLAYGVTVSREARGAGSLGNHWSFWGHRQGPGLAPTSCFLGPTVG